jgi:hypothetical protein
MTAPEGPGPRSNPAGAGSGRRTHPLPTDPTMQARLHAQRGLRGGPSSSFERVDLDTAWIGRIGLALEHLGLDPVWKSGRWEVRCPACGRGRGRRRAYVFDSMPPMVRCNRRNGCGEVKAVFTLLAEREGGKRGAFAWLRGQGTAPPARARPMPVEAAGAGGGDGGKPYPDRAELAAFVLELGALDDARDPRSGPAGRLLRAKGSDPACVATSGVARMAPRPGTPMPSWWLPAWLETHPIVIGAYDARGVLRSVHARALDADATPKTVWPRGCRASGLFFASHAGLALLRGEDWTRTEIGRVLIVEGLTDFLSATMWSHRERDRHTREPSRFHESPGMVDLAGNELGCGCARPTAVLGVTSGSLGAIGDIRWPAGMLVAIGTDADRAGDFYAERILAALPWGVRTVRVRWRGAFDA